MSCWRVHFIFYKYFCGSLTIMNFYSLKPNFFLLFEDGWNLKTMAYNKIDSTFASTTFYFLSVENLVWVQFGSLLTDLFTLSLLRLCFFLFGHFKHTYRAEHSFRLRENYRETLMRAFSETLAVHKKETEFAVVAICSFSSFYFSLFLRSKGSP